MFTYKFQCSVGFFSSSGCDAERERGESGGGREREIGGLNRSDFSQLCGSGEFCYGVQKQKITTISTIKYM